MRIFIATNTNNSRSLIVADTEDRAKEIGVITKLARKAANIRLKDITTEYIANHGPRGFALSTLSEGVLIQRINGKHSSWETFLL